MSKGKQFVVSLERPRLNALLDAGASAEILVVRGPGGSGKAELASDWLRMRPKGERSVWLEIDEDSRDLAGFRALLERTVEEAGISLFGVPDSPPDERSLTRVVVRGGHRLLPEAEQLLVRMAGEFPHLQFVVLTRQRGRMSAHIIEDLTARSIFNVVESDLRVTTEEAMQLAEAAGGELSEEQAAQLCDLTEGHLLTIRIALASTFSTHSHESGGLNHLAAAIAEAEDLVAETLIPPLTAEQEEKALILAHAPFVDDALAVEMTGDASIGELLDHFVSEGFGDIDSVGHFAFPAFMRRVLLRKAQERLTPPQRREALITAGDYLSRNGKVLEALRLYVDARTKDRIAPLFAANFAHIRENASEARAILLSLDEAEIAQDGVVNIALAVLGESKEPLPSAGTLQRVASGILEIQSRDLALNKREEFFRLLAIFAGLRVVRQLDEANDVGEQLLQLSKSIECAARSDTAEAFNLGIFEVAQSRILAGDLERGIQILDLLESDPQRVEERRVLRAYAHVLRGEIDLARSTLALYSRESSAVEQVRLVPWIVTEALVALEDGRAQKALAILREAEAHLLTSEHWPYALIALSLIHLTLEPQLGIDDLDRLMLRNRARPLAPAVRAMLDASMFDLALAAGQRGRAPAAHSDDAAAHVALAIASSRFDLISTPETAVASLHAVLERADLWPRQRVDALLLLAVHEHRNQQGAASLLALRRALALAESTGLRTPFMMVPAEDLDEIFAQSRGAVSLPVGLPNPFHAARSQVGLTTREQVVLQELASGASLTNIAQRHYLSVNTIKSQAASIYRKLGVGSRRAAVAYAQSEGMLPADGRDLSAG